MRLAGDSRVEMTLLYHGLIDPRGRFGSYLGALLVAQFGWVNSLWILGAFLFQFFPLGLFGMDW